jgi:acyl carrier protein
MAISAEAILGVIASEAGIDQDSLAPDATLQALDISSLDVVSAVFELEDRFGIQIDTDKISPEFTVAQLVDFIRDAAEPRPEEA